MPDTRLANARKTLPIGYQFGDAKYHAEMTPEERARLVVHGQYTGAKSDEPGRPRVRPE